MRNLLLLPLAIAGLTLAACAATADQAPAASASSARSAGGEVDEDGRICRNISVTGSRMKRERVCMTREEWRRYDENPLGAGG